MMAVQFGKKMGAKVIAVSKDNWIKTDFGADYIISEYDKVVEQVKDITQGKMADVVLNSLGVNTWENSFSCVGVNGRWVTFGGLTGAEVKLNIQSLYRNQIKLIGPNGSTAKEFKDVIDMSGELKVSMFGRDLNLKTQKKLYKLYLQRKGMVEFY
jgi:NADPH:quinone reductase-like Zn-dependent oxidoreductase